MWFSSLLKFVILIEGKGSTRFAKSLVVFRAGDFKEAKKRALDIGFSKEQGYMNGENVRIVWKLHSIETLDMLGKELEDGREVYSEFREIPKKQKLPFDTKLNPESSQPTATGV